MLSTVFSGLRHSRACTVMTDKSVSSDGQQPDNAAHGPARVTLGSNAQARLRSEGWLGSQRVVRRVGSYFMQGV